jgi:membrane fusion protein, copper/silver efflux system
MKRIILISIIIVGLLGLFVGLQELDFKYTADLEQGGGPGLMIGEAQAAKQELKAGMVDPRTGKKIKYWTSPMDPTYIRDEPGKSPMGMDLVPVYEEEGESQEPASTIRIDPVTMQNMGVRFGRVRQKALIKSIRTVANVIYDETKMFRVNTKFSGWIEKLYVNFVGEDAKKGQPLFEIYSPELVTAQEEYLLALNQYTRMSNSSYPRVREGSRRLLEASRIRLRYWDLTEKQIAQIGKTERVQKTLTIYSPATGLVTQKDAFEGHYVKEGEHQYEIVDLSSVWVDVDVYEYELPWVRKGMAAEMDLSNIPGKSFKGKVLFIYPYLDPKTRTAKLRLAFPNPGYQLKPGMYADIYLKSLVSEDSLVVPQEAVIDSGVPKIVFVALGQGKFQPREVKIGLEGNDNEFQVLEGLKESEEIVLSAQFMLDSKSRLRMEITQRAQGTYKGKRRMKTIVAVAHFFVKIPSHMGYVFIPQIVHSASRKSLFSGSKPSYTKLHVLIAILLEVCC